MARLIALFRIDTRSLALLRIVVAIGLLIAMPWCHATATDFALVTVLLAIAHIAGLALAFGYRSRVTAILFWITSAMILLADVGEFGASYNGLLGVLLLLSAVPCGASYSIDYAMGWVATRDRRIASPATAAIIVQIALSLIAVFTMNGSDLSGTATVTLFCAAFAVLMPTGLWNRIARQATQKHSNNLRIYYDRECGFCYKVCLLFRTFLLLGNTPIESAQSEPAVEKIMREHNSWVVYDRDGSCHLRWHAVLLLLRRSLLMRPIGRILTAIGMGYWGDFLYAIIAASRGVFSRLTVLILPLPSENRVTKNANRGLPIFWLVATLVANVYRALAPDSEIVDVIVHSVGIVNFTTGS